MIQKLKDWLSLPRLLRENATLKKNEVELQDMIGTLVASAMEERRLTLDDLKIKPNQRTELINIPSSTRQALFDLGEHVCLTEPKECCRLTAVKFRRYYMEQTSNPTKGNQIPSDRTKIDEVNERRAKIYSRPHEAT